MLCIAVAPQTPQLYYSNESLSIPVAVSQQSTPLVLSSSARLYCGSAAMPAANYTITFEFWIAEKKDFKSYKSFHISGKQLKFTSTDNSNSTLNSGSSYEFGILSEWIEINPTTLEVTASTKASINCTAENKRGLSTTALKVSLVDLVGK